MNAIQMIKIKDVVPTPDNPRHITKDDAKVKELAESIRKTGLLAPVICRPHPKQKGKYDLRAGFRRYLAVQALGQDEIAAIVRDMDDKTALEITVLENLQRENLTPLEEARGIQALLQAGKDPKVIAAEIGKSAVWIIRRAKLTNLTAEWIKAVENPNHDYFNYPAAFLELIARFETAIQNEILKKDRYEMRNCKTVKHFERFIADYTQRLNLAPWPLNNDILVARVGACTNCGKRSSCQPGLFDDELDQQKINANDTCLDRDCWDAKAEAWTKVQEADLRQEHPGLLKVATKYWSERPNDVIGNGYYEKAKKSEPGAKPALIVHGDGKGKLIYIIPELRSRGGRQVDADGKVKPATLKEKREGLQSRRVAWVCQHLKKLISKTEKAPKIPLEHFAALAATFGASSNWSNEDNSWGFVNHLLAGKTSILDNIWQAVSGPLSRTLNFYQATKVGEEQKESAENIAAILGLKYDDLLAQAEKEIPEPKAWGTEKNPPRPLATPPGRGSNSKAEKKKLLCVKCGHPQDEHNQEGSCTHQISINGHEDFCACLKFAHPGAIRGPGPEKAEMKEGKTVNEQKKAKSLIRGLPGLRMHLRKSVHKRIRGNVRLGE